VDGWSGAPSPEPQPSPATARPLASVQPAARPGACDAIAKAIGAEDAAAHATEGGAKDSSAAAVSVDSDQDDGAVQVVPRKRKHRKKDPPTHTKRAGN